MITKPTKDRWFSWFSDFTFGKLAVLLVYLAMSGLAIWCLMQAWS